MRGRAAGGGSRESHRGRVQAVPARTWGPVPVPREIPPRNHRHRSNGSFHASREAVAGRPPGVGYDQASHRGH